MVEAFSAVCEREDGNSLTVKASNCAGAKKNSHGAKPSFVPSFYIQLESAARWPRWTTLLKGLGKLLAARDHLLFQEHPRTGSSTTQQSHDLTETDGIRRGLSWCSA